MSAKVQPVDAFEAGCLESTETIPSGAKWYGACGVEYCADCLPRFNENNEQLPDWADQRVSDD